MLPEIEYMLTLNGAAGISPLIDTGGIEPGSDDVILEQMKAQAELAIDMADVIVFMVNVKDGMTAADKDVAAMLQKCGTPVILVANKVDNPGDPPMEKYTSFITLVLETPGRFHPFMVWASEIC